MLQCTQASTAAFHWISGSPPSLEGMGGIQLQLRHRMKPVPATVTLGPDGLSYVPSIHHRIHSRADSLKCEREVHGADRGSIPWAGVGGLSG